MLFYIIFDLSMACITFGFGLWFYKSNGRAAKYLSGYSVKSGKYDEENMCKSYGKHMMGMAVPFLVGIAIDLWKAGLGCLIAWGAWFVLFVLLLNKRDRRERDQ